MAFFTIFTDFQLLILQFKLDIIFSTHLNNHKHLSKHNPKYFKKIFQKLWFQYIPYEMFPLFYYRIPRGNEDRESYLYFVCK